MPFQVARSRKSMPFRNATPYNVSPRCTCAVAPYLGLETIRCDALEDEVSRTTLLLHATNNAIAAASVRVR